MDGLVCIRCIGLWVGVVGFGEKGRLQFQQHDAALVLSLWAVRLDREPAYAWGSQGSWYFLKW